MYVVVIRCDTAVSYYTVLHMYVYYVATTLVAALLRLFFYEKKTATTTTTTTTTFSVFLDIHAIERTNARGESCVQ